MNKYVVIYSTGQYDDHREHIEPMKYDGSIDELEMEFRRSWQSTNLKWKILNALYRLKLIGNLTRTGHQNYEIKIGSRYFDVNDFVEKNNDGEWIAYPPTIYTLNEWFEQEHEG